MDSCFYLGEGPSAEIWLMLLCTKTCIWIPAWRSWILGVLVSCDVLHLASSVEFLGYVITDEACIFGGILSFFVFVVAWAPKRDLAFSFTIGSVGILFLFILSLESRPLTIWSRIDLLNLWRTLGAAILGERIYWRTASYDWPISLLILYYFIDSPPYNGICCWVWLLTCFFSL